MNSKDSLSGVKILVVDDEPDGLEIMKLVLTFYQSEVIASPTAVEGLEQVQVHRPDIIVSDIGMPVMDGYQFIRAVRNLSAHNGKHTPAIALTAFHRMEDRARAIHAGFQRHLSKPVELHALIEAITSLVTHSHQTSSPSC